MIENAFDAWKWKCLGLWFNGSVVWFFVYLAGCAAIAFVRK